MIHDTDERVDDGSFRKWYLNQIWDCPKTKNHQKEITSCIGLAQKVWSTRKNSKGHVWWPSGPNVYPLFVLNTQALRRSARLEEHNTSISLVQIAWSITPKVKKKILRRKHRLKVRSIKLGYLLLIWSVLWGENLWWKASFFLKGKDCLYGVADFLRYGRHIEFIFIEQSKKRWDHFSQWSLYGIPIAGSLLALLGWLKITISHFPLSVTFSLCNSVLSGYKRSLSFLPIHFKLSFKFDKSSREKIQVQAVSRIQGESWSITVRILKYSSRLMGYTIPPVLKSKADNVIHKNIILDDRPMKPMLNHFL